MAKKCQSKKKEHKTRKCFKYEKEEHIAKNCKETQSIKKQQIQKGSDNKDEKKEQGFGDDLE